MEKGRGGFFPIFIPLEGEKVLVVGGGRIALRRIRTLYSFGAGITVIAPEILPEIRQLPVEIVCRGASAEDVRPDYRLVVAAASDRKVNGLIGARARALGIPVSVADVRGESTFYFPAIVHEQGIVAGVISENGGDHRLAAEKAALLRRALQEDEKEQSDGIV